MSITFGSFGDIIAAVQVACKLIEVLSAQRGAKREFRDLITDLRLFHRFLGQLLSFWQTREQGPLLDNLYDILQPVIRDSKEEISSFLERIISKYGRNLTSPSKRNPKDVGKMLQWQVSEHDVIAKLQDKLQKSKEIILMVQNHANTLTMEQNQALVAEKLTALKDAETEIMTKLVERLDRMETKAGKQSEILDLIYRSIGSISVAIDPIASAASNLSTMLAKIYTELLAQRVIHRSLNPFAHNSVFVEDALGWTFQVPLELIVSWNTVHSILLDRFENRPGCYLVKKRRYIMRDDLNGTELRQNVPLNLVLCPGQKVNMCMVYFSDEQHLMACPKCKESTLCANGSDITCLNPKCGMEIQRIEEVVDDTTIFNHGIRNTNDSIASADFDEKMLHADFDETLPTNLVSPCQTEDGPEIFKRVRFLSRWENREESRGPFRFRTGEYCWWRASCFEAKTIKNAVARVLSRTLSSDLLRTCKTWDTTIAVSLFFVGQSVQQSRPILVIFSMEKTKRKKAWKFCKDIDWVKAHPSLLLLTTCNSIFHDGMKRSRVKIGFGA